MKSAGILLACSPLKLNKATFLVQNKSKTIRIVKAVSDFEREKLINPFGFKGGYLTELWQTVSKIESDSGISKTGIATQSVLYGDSEIFAGHSEAAGNALMYVLTNNALKIVLKTPFIDPIDLLEQILPKVISAGKEITGKPDMNMNFAYNALVSIDNAAWLLYAAENGMKTFDSMIPGPFKKALGYRNNKIAVIYQVSYGAPVKDLKTAAAKGYFVFKIKAGYPGTQEEMLQRDIERLTEIHIALKEERTKHTKDGKLLYILDANTRYEKKETLHRYLEHAKKIGVFSQIILFEEPLSEHNEEDVRDTGIRIAADESVHTEADALKRIEQGYSAMVLKGIAKTLSMSMKIAKIAHEHNIPCMCADLTVNPILIDWHKNLAAHLSPFPGIEMGLMETNGDMNYRNWKNMINYHPVRNASWMQVKDGVFELNDDFYKRSGGVFETSPHYQAMFI